MKEIVGIEEEFFGHGVANRDHCAVEFAYSGDGTEEKVVAPNVTAVGRPESTVQKTFLDDHHLEVFLGAAIGHNDHAIAGFGGTEGFAVGAHDVVLFTEFEVVEAGATDAHGVGVTNASEAGHFDKQKSKLSCVRVSVGWLV